MEQVRCESPAGATRGTKANDGQGRPARLPRVLGLDPGLAHFGWAVVEIGVDFERVLAVGVFRTKKSMRRRNVRASSDLHRRGVELARGLATVIATHGPIHAFCAEALSSPRGASAAGKLQRSWGIVDDIVAGFDAPLLEATPQELKVATAGRATASKADVMAAVEARYPGAEALVRFRSGFPSGQWEHGFDAVGAVIASLDTVELRMVRQLARAAEVRR